LLRFQKQDKGGTVVTLPSELREIEQVAAAFRGLGHPTRLQILEQLRRDGPMSPVQLVRRLQPRTALGNVSHHARELRAMGLIVPAGTEPVRGALQHFYRLSPDGERLLGLVDQFVKRSV
jgi:DNA-binding transcriptional ArsR family regulator